MGGGTRKRGRGELAIALWTMGKNSSRMKFLCGSELRCGALIGRCGDGGRAGRAPGYCSLVNVNAAVRRRGDEDADITIALPSSVLADMTEQQQMDVAVERSMMSVDVCASDSSQAQRGELERWRRDQEEVDTCRGNAVNEQRVTCACLERAMARQLECDEAYNYKVAAAAATAAASRKRRWSPTDGGAAPSSLEAAVRAEPTTPASDCTGVVEAAEAQQDPLAAWQERRSKSFRSFLLATLWLCR